MILIANGQICIPLNFPTSAGSNPSRVSVMAGSSRRNILVMNPKDVVISAMKQPQKRSLLGLLSAESVII